MLFGRDRNCACRLLFFYLSKRIAFAALLIEVGLCILVVMTSLFHYFPPPPSVAGCSCQHQTQLLRALPRRYSQMFSAGFSSGA